MNTVFIMFWQRLVHGSLVLTFLWTDWTGRHHKIILDELFYYIHDAFNGCFVWFCKALRQMHFVWFLSSDQCLMQVFFLFLFFFPVSLSFIFFTFVIINFFIEVIIMFNWEANTVWWCVPRPCSEDRQWYLHLGQRGTEHSQQVSHSLLCLGGYGLTCSVEMQVVHSTHWLYAVSGMETFVSEYSPPYVNGCQFGTGLRISVILITDDFTMFRVCILSIGHVFWLL